MLTNLRFSYIINDMALVTTQQLTDYYDRYRENEIVLSSDMMKLLGMNPREIYVKCYGNQWPCIINSTSFQLCRIIVGVRGGAYAMLSNKDVNIVSVRFSFVNSDRQPVALFVNGRVEEIKPYMSSEELAVVTIAFTQRPPDDLIEKFGVIYDANENAIRRRDVRIVLNPDVNRVLGLEKKETVIHVQGVPRNCILQDLSFSGAKILMMGIPKFIENQPIVLQIAFQDNLEVNQIPGVIVRTSSIEGRKDILAAHIKFDEANIPIQYKISINNYMVMARKTILMNQQNAGGGANSRGEKADTRRIADLSGEGHNSNEENLTQEKLPI